jgi:phosphatidylinositol alpha-mannosyltransferase
VVVSADARDLAETALGGSYELLFNGIEVDRFAKATPWPSDGPTIFFIGRHEPRKGLAVLLEAMAHLPPSVRLWVGGDGPDTDALRRRHAGDPRIEWLGRISDDEKARRLKGADVFCAPSLGGESFGVVLLEGMAARTATVASDLPGYRNVARPGVDATLVEPGDVEALGAALRAVLTDADLEAHLVEGGTARAQHFSMDRLAERYTALFEDVVAEHGALRLRA